MPFSRSNYTVNRATEVISMAEDALELTTIKGVIFSMAVSGLSCCGSFYSAVEELFVVFILRRNK